MIIRGFRPHKKDTLGQAMEQLLKQWAEAGHIEWMSTQQADYQYNGRTGMALGLFSNLPQSKQEFNDVSPWMQLQTEPIRKRSNNKGMTFPNFGIDAYFGDRYRDVAQMVVPWLAMANYLTALSGAVLWGIEVKNVDDRRPLILTFETRKEVIKLALYGHILLRDYALIKADKELGVCYTDLVI